MKGNTEEETEAKLSQWVFGISGPVHLTSVDWTKPDHVRSIAASLVQGVYILERDRQQKRSGHKALAPTWWEFFNFQCIKTLIDQTDSSIYGAIFKHITSHVPNNQQGVHVTPRYVMVFRGTLMEPDTRKRDLYLDIQFPLNGLTLDSRYHKAIIEIQDILLHTSPNNFLLVGHSLGAAVVLQVGKDMAKRGCYIETYLFNPPYTSIPIEKINNLYWKDKIRTAKSIVTANVYQMVKKGNKDKNLTQHDPFLLLCSWIPNVYVNTRDPFCCEYIGHFEHRGRMKELGKDKVDVIASKNSLMSMLAGALGREGEPPHLIPSALLTKNMIALNQSLKEAHCIDQWWKPHQHWQSKLYKWEECNCM
ncbi:GDSL esterase/lipase At4g10955 [Beta vulgaris subsp. vulgaris]|uniref:GDSL esterase/lipase At4g10955 n=1 Tax=Beta vulgaris subsp. vulgaris TaxID=3555 RepID=UPI0020369462|nr:GDSL esterase/lipase At4g10955 [Beta vulgaris subsp. vulgaris]XP_057249501.1 GDSL esterase/lipase At4g10955 [Beta vulgaris subsp. vulgaris]